MKRSVFHFGRVGDGKGLRMEVIQGSEITLGSPAKRREEGIKWHELPVLKKGVSQEIRRLTFGREGEDEREKCVPYA